MEHATHMPPEERARVLKGYGTLPAGLREDIGAALASSWARTEPRQAAEWALTQARPEERGHPANRAADQVFLRWVNNDAAAALAWWRSLPASPLRDAFGTSASTFVAESGDLDAALELFRPSSDKSDADVTEHLAQFLTDRDPAKAWAWLRDLPDGTAVGQAMRNVVQVVARSRSGSGMDAYLERPGSRVT